MKLEGLKRFIAETRHAEGVNWYLRDQMPDGQFAVQFALTVFDDEGTLVAEIGGIEEGPLGQVESALLAKIASLRLSAGLNPGFVRSFPRGPEAARSHFVACRQAWHALPSDDVDEALQGPLAPG